MKTPPKSARKRVKAKLCWQDPIMLRLFESNIVGLDVGGPTVMHDLRPVFVLPADAQSIEEMRLTVDKVIEKAINRWLSCGENHDAASKVLRSLNLTAPPKQKGGK